MDFNHIRNKEEIKDSSGNVIGRIYELYEDGEWYWNSEAINSDIGHAMLKDREEAIEEVKEIYSENQSFYIETSINNLQEISLEFLDEEEIDNLKELSEYLNELLKDK